MSSVTTTVKVDVCSFSEYRMYPGRGTKFASRDGKVYFFLNSKVSRLGHKNIKPVKFRWTIPWRKANKKIQSTSVHRRRNKKTSRFQRSIVGLTLEELKSKRVQGPSSKAIKDAKDKARKSKQAAVAGTTAQGTKSLEHSNKPYLEPKSKSHLKSKSKAQEFAKKPTVMGKFAGR